MMTFLLLLSLLLLGCICTDNTDELPELMQKLKKLQHQNTMEIIQVIYNNFKPTKLYEQILDISEAVLYAKDFQRILHIINQYHQVTFIYTRDFQVPLLRNFLDNIIQRLLTTDYDEMQINGREIRKEIITEIRNLPVLKELKHLANSKEEEFQVHYQLLFIYRLLNAREKFLDLFTQMVLCIDGELPKPNADIMKLMLEGIEMYSDEPTKQCQMFTLLWNTVPMFGNVNDVYYKLFMKIRKINADCAKLLMFSAINVRFVDEEVNKAKQDAVNQLFN